MPIALVSSSGRIENLIVAYDDDYEMPENLTLVLVPDNAHVGDIFVNGVLQKPALPPKTKLDKFMMWERTTDAEAAAMAQAMQAQPVRLQQMFLSAGMLHADSEFFPQITAVLTALFGAERAVQILELTE